MTSAGDPPTQLRVAARRFGPGRRAFFRLVERSVALAGGRAHYRRRYLARGRLLERRETKYVADLPPHLDGFVIAQLSDLHGGAFLGRGDLAQAVESINAAQPDLIVITGDLITRHWSEAVPLVEDLARLEAPCGTFAVFGNHDYHDRMEGEIEERFGAVGIRFLRNAHERLALQADRGLALVGVEDLEEGRVVDLDGARRGVGEHDVEVVLCHNPLGAREIARPQCALILSGHTHGGQIDWPWLRGLGPDHPGTRVEVGATTLIVNRGLGVVGVPFRAGAPAEWVRIELRRPPAGD